MLQGTRGRTARRAWPIHGYIGPNGGGKTLAAVWDTMPSLSAGRHCLATVRLLDFENPRPCDDPRCESEDHEKHMAAHPLWIPWTSWTQLLEVEHCDVIADEVTGVASSRDSQSMPHMVANALVQLRRRDVVLRWTAPSWARADLIIRECSQAATLCSGFFPVTVRDSAEDRMWRHRRLFRWLTYDATLLDDLTNGKRERMNPWTREVYWGPGSPGFQAYDTFDSVSSIGHVSDAGRCMSCGGRRTAPACACPGYEPPARRTRSEAGSPRKRSARGASDGGEVLTITPDRSAAQHEHVHNRHEHVSAG